MERKKNLLIIGASGGVGRAFLRKITKDRKSLGRLTLLDRSDALLEDPFLSHHDLDYDFLKAAIDVDNDREDYLHLLKSRGIDIVIDLSVNETRKMLELTDRAGASYVNTGIANRFGENFSEVVLDIHGRSVSLWNAPHILCSGMNPGIVNMWVRRAIEKNGVPRSIVHFEYDTGQPVDGWMPVIAWSRETLLDEIVNDPAGYVEGRDKIRFIQPNPLKNRVPMEDILHPIMDLPVYPRGFLLLHEENITLGQRYDVPSRFLFSLDTRTMDYLEKVYDQNKGIPLDTLALGDNRVIPLKGSATVGVCLEYEKTREYFFNNTAQGAIPGVSGSCWQVAAGLHSALWTVMADSLDKRVYFVEDLLGTTCEKLMIDNLPMQELVIHKGYQL
jgi:hypothetical protein